jgi:hypothetical protein
VGQLELLVLPVQVEQHKTEHNSPGLILQIIQNQEPVQVPKLLQQNNLQQEVVTHIQNQHQQVAQERVAALTADLHHPVQVGVAVLIADQVAAAVPIADRVAAQVAAAVPIADRVAAQAEVVVPTAVQAGAVQVDPEVLVVQVVQEAVPVVQEDPGVAPPAGNTFR